jgi:hypothetical protein
MTKYITPISTGTTKEGIKNACVIRCIANATGKPYEEVQQKAFECTDYKIGRGLLTKDVLTMFSTFGFEFLGSVGTTKGALFFKKFSQSPNELPGMTVEKMLKLYPKGTFAATIQGHAFCFKDAQIIDICNINKNLRVIAIWEFKDNS